MLENAEERMKNNTKRVARHSIECAKVVFEYVQKLRRHQKMASE